MAGIVLKDGNGNSVTYGEVAHVQVVEDSGAKRTYTDMSTLRTYYGTYDDGTGKYTIAGLWFTSKGAGYAVAASNGNYSIIITSKMLTTGASYYPSELGGI